MGILNDTIKCLKNNGVRVQRAYPGAYQMPIGGVVAAVQLGKMERYGAEVRVNVLSPVNLGGSVSEDEAIRIFQVLQNAGGVCAVEKCSYLSDAEAFCTPVTAFYAGEEKEGAWIPYREPEPEPEPETETE